MDPEHQEAAVLAAMDWTERGFPITLRIVPESEANFRLGDCSDLDPNAAACTRSPGGDLLLVVDVVESCRWIRIDGMTRCLLMDTHLVLLHEIGHWLGFMDHLPEGNVMQPRYPLADFPAELTDADVDAVRRAQ